MSTSLFPQLSHSGLRFFVKKIANSKKEVQVSFIDKSVNSYETGYFHLFNPYTGREGVGNNDKVHIYSLYQSLTMIKYIYIVYINL